MTLSSRKHLTRFFIAVICQFALLLLLSAAEKVLHNMHTYLHTHTHTYAHAFDLFELSILNINWNIRVAAVLHGWRQLFLLSGTKNKNKGRISYLSNFQWLFCSVFRYGLICTKCCDKSLNKSKWQHLKLRFVSMYLWQD